MHSNIYFLTFIASFFFACACLLILLKYCYKYRLFDYIDGRKVHVIQVPRLGGSAFFPVLCLSIVIAWGFGLVLGADLSIKGTSHSPIFALLALFLVYAEGLWDDLKGVGYKLKFLTQFVSAALLIFSGCSLTHLGGLFGMATLSPWVALPLTFVLIVGIVNAVNLIDGVDGLSSALCSLALGVFAWLFACNGMPFMSILSLSMLAILVVFFCFNVFGTPDTQTKIFMGDCGSQTVGLLLAFLAVQAARLPFNGANGAFASPLLLAFAVLIVPCFDTVRVMVGRMRRGKSPFHADKTHIHHKFLSLGLTHLQITGIVVLIALFFLLLSIGLSKIMPLTAVLITVATWWIGMHLWLNDYLRKKGCLHYFEEREKL